MQKLDLEQLSDILAASTILNTEIHSGMLIHTINHPELGSATTIQGDSGGLLITG
jgi:hypothetical protein